MSEKGKQSITVMKPLVGLWLARAARAEVRGRDGALAVELPPETLLVRRQREGAVRAAVAGPLQTLRRLDVVGNLGSHTAIFCSSSLRLLFLASTTAVVPEL